MCFLTDRNLQRFTWLGVLITCLINSSNAASVICNKVTTWNLECQWLAIDFFFNQLYLLHCVLSLKSQAYLTIL